jgi:hypothetical protein
VPDVYDVDLPITEVTLADNHIFGPYRGQRYREIHG